MRKNTFLRRKTYFESLKCILDKDNEYKRKTIYGKYLLEWFMDSIIEQTIDAEA